MTGDGATQTLKILTFQGRIRLLNPLF